VYLGGGVGSIQVGRELIWVHEQGCMSVDGAGKWASKLWSGVWLRVDGTPAPQPPPLLAFGALNRHKLDP
jgi:hypothetical protein